MRYQLRSLILSSVAILLFAGNLVSQGPPPCPPVCPPPSQGQAIGIRDTSRDLVIKNSDATPASVVDITAAEVILQNGSGAAMRVAPVAVSVDAEAAGANGLDIGITEPANWYHIWLIFNPASDSVAGLLSLAPDNPELPPGYEFKARVGAIRTELETGALIRIHQVGNRVVRERAPAIIESAQVFNKSVSIENLVPSTAKVVSGSLDTYRYATAGYGRLAASPQRLGSSSFGYVFTLDGRQGNLNDFGSYQLTLVEPQTMYLTLFSGTVLVTVSGWEF